MCHFIPSVYHFIPSLGHFIPSLCHFILSVNNLIPSVCHFIPSLSVPSLLVSQLPLLHQQSLHSNFQGKIPLTALINSGTNNQLGMDYHVRRDRLETQFHRPTRAVTTNWAESSEVTCAPPLMVGPLQRNALHAHCTPLSPSICDKQNYI